MCSIARTSSAKLEKYPVELAIYNYPASKPDLEKIKEVALDRLTIVLSAIDDELLNSLDGLKFKNLTLEACSMTGEAMEVLGLSTREQATFIRCCVVDPFTVPCSEEVLDNFGILKINEEIAFFNPRLRALAQKQSLIPQEILKTIDASETQEITPIHKKIDLEDKQKKLRERFENLLSDFTAVLQTVKQLRGRTLERRLAVPPDRRWLWNRLVSNITQLVIDTNSLSKMFVKAGASELKINASLLNINESLLKSMIDLKNSISIQIERCRTLIALLEPAEVSLLSGIAAVTTMLSQ